MSTTQIDLDFTDHTETPERAFLVRTYEAELEVGTGRTIDVRIVPYGETATAVDGFGGVARGVPYQEEWMPGVFNHQLNAANRVLANVEHEPGIRGVVGRGLALREAPDGFHGSFLAHEDSDGDKALMLIKEGVYMGISLEAHPVKNVRSVQGIVQRVRANLRAIAFCREGAFAGAQVLAVREAHTVVDEIDEGLLPIDIDPEAIERCRRLGIALPQRYQAQPAEDTPEESGTPETAPAEETVNSETSEES